MKEPLWLEPLFPDRTTGEPLGVQLARRLREAVERGTLAHGTKMPGSRQLAQRLGLGRNTVALAYELLTVEGYFEARSGSGTFVSTTGLATREIPAHEHFAVPETARTIGALRAHFTSLTGEGPLRPGMPSLAHFPAHTWRRCGARALKATPDLGYGPASGQLDLREAIALHVRHSRGINALPQQIIVVEGAQAALHLANVVLTRPGDSMVLEDPAYGLARAAFETYGLRLHPVSVEADGLRTEDLPAHANCAYVTPTHQYPLGGTLPLRRRLELLAWANRMGAYILEDDYDSEFTSLARSLPALQSLDRDGRVIYIGSFSKTLAPGIRMGYLIVPRHLASAFRAARASTSLGVTPHLQTTMAAFMRDGHFGRHIRRMNAIYEKRRGMLGRVLETVAISFDRGPMLVGLHVALVAKQPFDDVAASEVLPNQRLVALSPMCIARNDCYGFLLGFTNGTDSQIETAAHGLIRSLHNPGPVRERSAANETAHVVPPSAE